MNTDHQGYAEAQLSKTAVKKNMLELQNLGEQLINLSPSELQNLLHTAEVTLGHSVAEAIKLAKKLKSGNALRRQVQLIGKLLREEDHESLKFYIDKFQNIDIGKPPSQLEQCVNKWFDRLITDHNLNESMTDFISQYPSCNRQQLHQLIRNSKKKIIKNNSAEKKLREAIKTILQENTSTF